MKKALFVIISVIFATIEMSLSWRFSIGWHNLGFALCAIISVSLLNPKTGLISAIICGILTDCVQGRYFGTFIIIYLITVGIVALSSSVLDKKSFLSAIILALSITFPTELLQYIIFFIPRGAGNISFALTKLIIPQTLYNAVLIIPMYVFIKFLWKKLKVEKGRWGY